MLAGGTALLEGMVEETAQFFQCQTRLGKLQEVQAPKPLFFPWATAVGLLRYGFEKQKEERELLPEGVVGKVMTRVKELLLDYF